MRTSMLLIALGLVANIGCGGDFCSKNYDKRKECASSDQLGLIPEKSEYVEKCQEEESKAKKKGEYDEEVRKAQMECLGKGSCEEVTACMSEQHKKERAKKKLKEIAEAGKSDDIEKMENACKYIDEDNAELVAACKPVLEKLATAVATKAAAEMKALVEGGDKEKMMDECQYTSRPEKVEACKPVLAKLVEVFTAEITTMRDEGKYDYSPCADLGRFAESVSPEAKAKATLLCEETKASEKVAKAVSESAARVKAGKAEMPYECKSSLKQIGEIDTEWAKGAKTKVIKACYEELGLTILEAKVPTMKYSCNFRVKEVYKAVKEHKIDNAKISALMTTADALCSKAT